MPLPTAPTRVAVSIKDYISMFYGPPGVGKTTFVNDFGRVLFISTDRGTRFLNTMRQDCLRWEDFQRVIKELETPGAPRYDFIAVDHVDDMANMAEDWVCKSLSIDSLGDAGFGKGWKAFRREIENFVRRLLRLNTGMVFIAHEEIKTVKTRGIELQRTMPSLGKSAWKVVVPMADLIGYCGFRTIRNPDKSLHEIRVVETTPKESLYAKDRTLRARSPIGYEPLDGAAFIKTFLQGVSHGRQESSSKAGNGVANQNANAAAISAGQRRRTRAS